MLEKAIICDLDGTLSNSSWRVHYLDATDGKKKDWNAFNAGAAFDQVHQWCLDLIYVYHGAGHKIIFLTARAGSPETRSVTETWLRANVYVDYQLFMRKNNDYRPDFVVKQEIYNLDIAPFYDVRLAIDDKPAVCQMWATCGVPTVLCDNF